MSDIVTRLASREDLPRIKEIAVASPWTKHVTHISYCHSGRFDNGEVTVAEVNGAIVGFVIAHRRRQTHDVKIDMISVSADAGRSGVGRALVESLGGETLVLNVAKENAVAQAFYARVGFARRGESRDGTCWVMRRRGWRTLF
ncbi:MAG: GNAT family N-acetyltransferase [Elusimicrobia bacterium]|nr:GNAT family N-acetyltransferase [Elusimicrobiota bacterium]